MISSWSLVHCSRRSIKHWVLSRTEKRQKRWACRASHGPLIGKSCIDLARGWCEKRTHKIPDCYYQLLMDIEDIDFCCSIWMEQCRSPTSTNGILAAYNGTKWASCEAVIVPQKSVAIRLICRNGHILITFNIYWITSIICGQWRLSKYRAHREPFEYINCMAVIERFRTILFAWNVCVCLGLHLHYGLLIKFGKCEMKIAVAANLPYQNRCKRNFDTAPVRRVEKERLSLSRFSAIYHCTQW